MDWNARIRLALKSAVVDDDVVEELAQHARATYEAARADGCSHDEAETLVARLVDRWQLEAAALRRPPGRPAAVEPPPAASSSAVSGLGQDAWYALRRFRRQPRFALLTVVTMALGIGATTALFGVTYGVLMKPLPWPDVDRIVVLKETRGGSSPRFGSFSNAAYLAWRESPSTLEELAAWTYRTVTLTGAGDPERIRVTAASAGLFRVLGVRPLIGSLFTDADEGAPVAVLSEGLWRQRFGADPQVLGRSVHFDGEPFTVVAIVADAVSYPDRQSRAWVPLRVAAPTDNLLSMFETVAKLRPGVTPEQATAEGASRGRFAVNTRLTTMAIFGSDGPIGVTVTPLRDAIVGGVRRPLLVLLAGVLLLLVIAATNIASLQLVHAMTRRRELAIRAAIGASSGRVVRQLLVENLLLALAGGAGGLAVGWALHRGARAILPADFPRLHDLSLDGVGIAFAAAASLAACLVFGLLPALRVRRLDLVASLTQDGPRVSAGARSAVARPRLFIVAGQVALSCVLLVTASLLVRSFVELLHADRGFDPARVLSAPIPMPAPGYSPERRRAVLHDIIDRLAATPGIRSVGFTSEAPLTPGGSTSALTLPSRDGSTPSVAVQASPRLVSPDYFSALGLQMIAGRPLQDSDTETSQPVAVVNETFARQYLGDAPLGAKIPMGVWGDSHGGAATIVGVVDDIRYVGAGVRSLPEMYFSYRQIEAGMRSATATLVMRADGGTPRVADAVRHAVRQSDPTLVAGSVMTLEDRLLATSLARPRLYAGLLATFAAVAVAITTVGLFAVLSYSVAQRTHELGVRSALGARPRDLVVLIASEGLGAAVAGITAGLLASAWCARFLQTLLHGVSTGDRLTYIGAPLILLAVAAAASFTPARRAARIDPLRAMRV